MGPCVSKKPKENKRRHPKRTPIQRYSMVLEVTRLSAYYKSQFQIGERIEFTEFGMPGSDRYRHDGQVIFGRSRVDGNKDVYFNDADRYCSKLQAKIFFDREL